MSHPDYVKSKDVRVGDELLADGGFTCISEGVVLMVDSDADGLFVVCSEGKHYLEGQECAGGFLVGLRRGV